MEIELYKNPDGMWAIHYKQDNKTVNIVVSKDPLIALIAYKEIIYSAKKEVPIKNIRLIYPSEGKMMRNYIKNSIN